MFPIRLLSPLIAVGIAGFYFLPETTENIMALTKRYEAQVPVIRDAHQKIVEELDLVKKETKKEVEQVSEKLGMSSSQNK